jgi:hypothetical protein
MESRLRGAEKNNLAHFMGQSWSSWLIANMLAVLGLAVDIIL